jgi:transcription antitermination factor NusG
MTEVLWYVAHTRPRCEKKLVDYCRREGFPTTLPTYRSVKRYRGKTVVFHKPLFPGYLFLQIDKAQRQKVYQSDYVANLLEVFDQATFVRQLEDILKALETELEIRLAPQIGEGHAVRIKAGPLRGLEGWVEQRYGPTTVLLRLDFIGKAAAVKVHADELELI